MKAVAIVTSTRAEYGLLSPVIKQLRQYEDSDFKVDLIVTGTHLSPEFGMTVDEIEKKLRGNECGMKGTSCADQLAIAVREALNKEQASV